MELRYVPRCHFPVTLFDSLHVSLSLLDESLTKDVVGMVVGEQYTRLFKDNKINLIYRRLQITLDGLSPRTNGRNPSVGEIVYTTSGVKYNRSKESTDLTSWLHIPTTIVNGSLQHLIRLTLPRLRFRYEMMM